jgi:DNA-binding winged helix-turn-helix (wHTH) protein/tetratricopeptide (TPR) repeat protein
VVSFPPYRIDVEEERLWRGSNLLGVRRKPFAILKYLAAHPGRVVTHDELLENVWGEVVVSESAVRTHMHELRQVLGDGVIETVVGRGYRFTAALEPDAPKPSARATGTGRIPKVTSERPLVGRDAELATLRAAVDRAATGARQTCFVLGDPGIGKTTLIDAVLDGLDDREDVVVARGQCVEQHGAPEAYLPVTGALAQLVRSAHGERAFTALWRHAPAFLAQLPHLVPEEKFDELARRASDAGAGSDGRTARQLVEAIEAFADTATLVLGLEDLQWSDVATVDLLSLLAQRRHPARVVVIASARRAELAASGHPLDRVIKNLAARGHATSVALAPLAAADTQRYLDERFPGHTFPPALASTIDAIAGGVPLFTTSFVDDLVARTMIAWNEKRAVLLAPLASVAAHRPQSVTEMLDLQLDRLSPDEQRTLEAAAVAGAEFATGLVAAALESTVDVHDDRCDELARRGMFVRRIPSEDWPDGTAQSRFAFTHALVREACTRRTTEMRRSRWHRLVGERLEAAYGASATDHAAALAHHFDRGQDVSKAVGYYAIAAERSQRRKASRDAMTLFRRAIELVRRLPESPARDRQELALLFGVAPATVRVTGEAGRNSVDSFLRMVELAERLGEPVEVCRALVNLGARYGTLGFPRRALETFARFRAVAATTTLPPELAAYGHAAEGMGRFWSGDLRASEAVFAALTRDLVVGSLVDGPTLGMLNAIDRAAAQMFYLGMARWCMGKGEQALAISRRAFEIGDVANDPFVTGMARCNHGRILVLRGGRAADAIAYGEWVLAAPECELWHTSAALLVGAAKLQIGALTAADVDPLLRTYHQRVAEFPIGATVTAGAIVETLARHGRAGEANAILDDVLAFVEDHGEYIYLPELLRVRGDLRRDPASYREAIERADAMGAPAYALRAALALARATKGDAEALAAVRAFAAAITEDVDSPDMIAARSLLATA